MAEHDINIITALDLVDNKMRLRSKTSDVLKASDIDYDSNRKQIIGGDTTDFEHDRHPAIIIEKNGEQMSKIIVRCPCGRHSELVCEYEDEIGTAVETQAGGNVATEESAAIEDAPSEEPDSEEISSGDENSPAEEINPEP